MVILAAIESTYGSDASPTGSANAILVRNPDLTPLNAQTTQRNTVRPTLGRELQIHYGVHVQLQFEVEIACRRVPASASLRPMYDPTSERVRA